MGETQSNEQTQGSLAVQHPSAVGPAARFSPSFLVAIPDPHIQGRRQSGEQRRLHTQREKTSALELCKGGELIQWIGGEEYARKRRGAKTREAHRLEQLR